MPQIVFRPGLPLEGAYGAPQDPLAGFRGPTFKGGPIWERNGRGGGWGWSPTDIEGLDASDKWCMCIALHTCRPIMHYKADECVPGACEQSQTEMFLFGAEMSLSIATASGLSSTCSMLAVRQQRKPCHQFVDVSAAQRGRHTQCRSCRNVSNWCQ